MTILSFAVQGSIWTQDNGRKTQGLFATSGP
jgi:hypothetical protein